MKSSSIVLGYLLAAVLAGVTLAWLLAPLLPLAYDKVISRAILLAAALGLVPLWRYFDLNTHSVGLRPVPAGRLLPTWLLGVAAVLPLMLFFLVVGFRVEDSEELVFSPAFAGFAVLAFVSAWLVGLFEETLFRGVLLTLLGQRFSFYAAALLSSGMYAAVHFINRAEWTELQWAENGSSWLGGLTYVGHSLSGIVQAGQQWDSWLALFLLGLLFCRLRRDYGLWVCIALHAAWVFSIRVYKQLTVRDIVNPFREWTGEYDNFVGHLASVWLLFILLALYLAHRHHQMLRRAPAGSTKNN